MHIGFSSSSSDGTPDIMECTQGPTDQVRVITGPQAFRKMAGDVVAIVSRRHGRLGAFVRTSRHSEARRQILKTRASLSVVCQKKPSCLGAVAERDRARTRGAPAEP